MTIELDAWQARNNEYLGAALAGLRQRLEVAARAMRASVSSQAASPDASVRTVASEPRPANSARARPDGILPPHAGGCGGHVRRYRAAGSRTRCGHRSPAQRCGAPPRRHQRRRSAASAADAGPAARAVALRARHPAAVRGDGARLRHRQRVCRCARPARSRSRQLRARADAFRRAGVGRAVARAAAALLAADRDQPAGARSR